MDQQSMKKEYERRHSTEAAARIRSELDAKFALIVDGVKPSEIKELINEKTGEKFYTRIMR